MTPVRLDCAGVAAGYHGHAVVRGVDLTVDAGEIVALLGPNGAGKTTLLLTLAGLLPPLAGTIRADGHLVSADAVGANRRGMVLVPDDRSLFRTLTVDENLRLARGASAQERASVLELFPALAPRRAMTAGMLSGGEQQMLAIGRALVQRPRTLLIDELSMGLAPIVVSRILTVLRDVADTGQVAIVLVEQHVRRALETADRALVLVHGRTELQGGARELLEDPDRLERAYLS